jgi:hypothetical protein
MDERSFEERKRDAKEAEMRRDVMAVDSVDDLKNLLYTWISNGTLRPHIPALWDKR